MSVGTYNLQFTFIMCCVNCVLLVSIKCTNPISYTRYLGDLANCGVKNILCEDSTIFWISKLCSCVSGGVSLGLCDDYIFIILVEKSEFHHKISET